MKNDLKKVTLEKIKETKPKSKSYFRFLKSILYGAAILLSVIAIYIFNLMFYLPGRTTRMIESGRFIDLVATFPWALLLIGSVIAGILVYLYRHYDGGYKKQFAIVALLIIGALLVLGALTATTRINERLEKGPHFRRFYQWNEDNFVPRRPHRNMNFDRSPATFRQF